MFATNAKSQATSNNNYRKVIFTTSEVQLVYMTLKMGEDIPKEVHDGTQVFNIISGHGFVQSGSKKKILSEGVVAIIPPFTEHYVKNTSKTEKLKFWTLYTPPEHPDGTMQRNKPLND
jgi:mannose-6-phosphate isomerase-like protein (cupin superfamily)